METIKTGTTLRDAFGKINTNFSTIESDYATQEYVEENGGKIDSISVNGEAQTIDENKNVDLDIPEGVPVIDNDDDRGDSNIWVNTSEDYPQTNVIYDSDTDTYYYYSLFIQDSHVGMVLTEVEEETA